MKIGEHLYFAPGVRFGGLDVNAATIVEHFHSRIENYYLIPARLLAERDDAFAATLLLASAIDAIARYASQPNSNRKRYIGWLQTELPSLASELLATQFYEKFRCGLVHEGRAKDGCAFTTHIGGSVFVEDGIMAINPKNFVEDVSTALNAFCGNLNNSVVALNKFQTDLKGDFKQELSN